MVFFSPKEKVALPSLINITSVLMTVCVGVPFKEPSARNIL